MRSYQKSLELYQRAKESMAGGVSSQFRAAEQPHPLFYARAEGSRVWDVDGNEYIDFTLSQGPMFLGHSQPAVVKAAQESVAQGQLYAAQHEAELLLAEALKRIIPCAELVRFSVSGSEAVQAALRLARSYTKRSKIVKFEGHYHGWLDSVAFSVAPSLAVAGSADKPRTVPWTDGIAPGSEEHLIILPWNNLDLVRTTFEERASDIAAVITEPMMCNSGCILPEPGFLEGLREACDRYGVVLIFDEIITGFRVALGGAQAYFNVVPDLAVFGKAMGSGFPISALVGPRKIMELCATGQSIHAGTMNAQNTCVAVALATVRELEKNADKIYGRLSQLGEALRTTLADAAAHSVHNVLIQGLGPVFHLGFTSLKKVKDYRDTLSYDDAKYHRFCNGMRERGIRLIARGIWYLSAAHTGDDIDKCADAARETFAELVSRG